MRGNSLTQQGAVLIALSAVLFALVGVVVKHLSEQLPNTQIVFFRNSVGLLALVPFLWRDGWAGLSTRALGGHMTRALAGVGAMYLSFFAVGRMRLADAYVLSYTAPLFMPFLAKGWLGEAIPRHALGALALGFGGVLFILKPGAAMFQPVALVAVASGFLGAVAQVGVRQLARTEPPTRIVFYFGVFATAMSAPPLLGSWRPLTAGLWGMVAVLGILATVAQLLMTEGYRRASPGDVGSLMYVAVATVGVLDAVLWRRVPDVAALVGMALIVGAGVWIIHATGAGRATSPAPIS